MQSISLVALTLLGTAHAFMPWDWNINVSGMGGVSHSAITRNAFQNRAAAYWPSLTKNGIPAGMATARDAIAYANGMVDVDQQHSAKHFDGENFPGGQYVITGYPWWPSWAPIGVNSLPSNEVNLFSQVLSNLNSGNAAAARTALGKALHTIQDFYSHSNYVEMGYRVPHPGLGRAGNWINFPSQWESTCTFCGNPLLSASARQTCSAKCWSGDQSIAGLCADDCNCNDCSSNIITSGLTSGYYHGEDAVAQSGVKKCDHGGDLDSNGNIKEGINKDSYDCSWSSHGPSYHWIAQDLARQASEQFIGDVRAAITSSKGSAAAESQMRLLFGVGSVLAFVVDTTAGMADVMGAVTTQLTKIVNERIGTLSEPSTYVFAPFSATWSLTPVVTSSASTFLKNVGWLWSYGGGSCGEPSLQGLLTAIPVVDAGSTIFLITEAPASDTSKLSSVVSAANAKGIHIFIFLFKSTCSDDGTYAKLASSTGGQFFPLARTDAAKITQQVDYWLSADLTKTTQVSGSSSSKRRRAGTESIEVPVCGLTTAVQFVVNGVGNSSISLTRPDGTTCGANDTDVTITTLSAAKIFTIDSPLPGSWGVNLNNPGTFTLDVTARSPISFSFCFAEYIGRPGHSGWSPNPDIQPHAGVDMPALAYLDGGDFTEIKFQIRGTTGDIIVDDIPFSKGSGLQGLPANTFFGHIKLPESNCLIHVTGKDSTGTEFVRVHAVEYIPTLNTDTSGNYSVLSIPDFGASAPETFQAVSSPGHTHGYSYDLELDVNQEAAIAVAKASAAALPQSGLNYPSAIPHYGSSDSESPAVVADTESPAAVDDIESPVVVASAPVSVAIPYAGSTVALEGPAKASGYQGPLATGGAGKLTTSVLGWGCVAAMMVWM